MAQKLALVAGIPRMVNEGTSSANIYDQTINIVASGAGAGELNGPIAAGTPITLPSAQTYTSVDLEIFLNGDRLTPLYDYTYVGSGARTQVAFTFDLLATDRIVFRIDAGSGSPSTSGIVQSINVVAANTAAGAVALTNYTYLVSGATTITLPTAVGNTNMYTVKRIGTSTVTIATTSGQTIDGSASATILVQYNSLTFVSDGANWSLI